MGPGRRTSPALLVAIAALAAAAIACTTIEAKPGEPVVYGGTAQTHGHQEQSQPSISISGEGRATAPPDAARVRVTIKVVAPTGAEARDEGKGAINQLLETVAKFGARGQDVETRSFSISPISQRDEDSGESRTVEYRLNNVSIVTLREVERVGELLDRLTRDVGDVLSVNSITLAVEDPSEIQRQARENAMQDALHKAEQLADLSGVTLGPPISVSESSDDAPGGALAKEVLVAPVEEGLEPDAVGELEAVVSTYVVYSLLTP